MLIASGKDIDKLYIDTTTANFPGNPHLYIGILQEQIPEEFKSKVFCMHVNNDQCIEEAKNAEPVEEEAFKIEDEEPVSIEFEENDSNDKDSLISLLSDNGINYLDYTGQELDHLIENYDENLISENIQVVKDTNVGTEIFVNHTELMLDNELSEKINILLELGKEPIDIYLNPSVLEKYSKENLKDVIESLKNNGMDPKNVPLMAY